MSNTWENLQFSSVQPLIILLLSIALFRYLQWRRGRRHMYEFAAKIPYPKGVSVLPFIGHAHHFIGNTEKILNNILHFGSLRGPSTVWLGDRLYFCISNPKDLEVILKSPKCLEKDDMYRYTQPIAGFGLFNANVATWRKNRKIVMPTFNQKILDQFAEVFAEQAEIFVRVLETRVGDTFDVFDLLFKCTLDTVCETAMGISVNSQLKESKMAKSMSRCLEIAMMRMFNVPYHYDFIFKYTPLAREERKHLSYVHNFTDKIIEQKQKDFKKMYNERLALPEAQIEDKITRKVFLDLLLELSENGTKVTAREMRDEVNTFIIAGSDTSATVLSFLFLMLALYPDIEQKVYEEIMDEIGPARVEFTHLPHLKYLEMVIKETMRLFPIGPAIVRKVSEDLELESCTLPKGAGLVLAIGATHRLPEYFKNPLEFDPERFTQEEMARRHAFSYLPFSGGPRNCVGVKYGMMVVKTIVATVVRKYRFETDFKNIQDIRLKQSLIIKAVNGFPVRIIPRT